MKMHILAEYSFDEIAPLIGMGDHDFIINDVSYTVRMNSTRLRCFKRSRKCSHCWRVGFKFRLEVELNEWIGPSDRLSNSSLYGACYVENCQRCRPIYRSVGRPHFNLYAPYVRGMYAFNWTLMTQDHILPKSRGGTNDMTNLQTMCCHCNQRKGSGIPRRYRNIKAEPMEAKNSVET